MTPAFWAALVQVAVCAMAPMLLRLLDVRLVLALGLLISTIGARLATYIDSDWVLVDILPSHLIQASGQPLIRPTQPGPTMLLQR